MTTTTLADDGTTLVFRTRRAGRFGVVMRKLGTTAETISTRVPEDHYPAVSRDGTKGAYSFRQSGRMPIFVVAATAGRPNRSATTAAKSRDGHRQATRSCISLATIRQVWGS
jgi:hypothetical protein